MTDHTDDPALPGDRDDREPAGRLGWYADAFSVDRNHCWRYITRGGFRGIPRRCPDPINWAGRYDTRDGIHHRVWSCDGHLSGGHSWIPRPGSRAGRR